MNEWDIFKRQIFSLIVSEKLITKNNLVSWKGRDKMTPTEKIEADNN